MRILLKPAEVARAVGVSDRTVKNWAEVGKIKSIRLPGGHIRIHESELRRLLGESNQAQRSDPSVQ